ncbi:MAG: beta-1,6-N-acetylglucosaminyltransferase [Pseudomonadota bacterium]
MSVRFVFFVIAHAQPRQLAWLVRAIANPNDLTLIHINARTKDADAAVLRAAVAGAPGVAFMPQRPVGWGGWGLAEVDLDAMSFALQNGGDWDYFVNLSGQDYPLVSVDQMRAALEGEAPRTYLEARPVRDLAPHFRLRSLLRHAERGGRPRRTLLPNLAPRPAPALYQGLKWGVFHRDFCAWLMADSARLERACAFFRPTKIPDESLLSTMLMASPFAQTRSDDHKRFVDFEGGKPNPKRLASSDWDALIQSDAFFARKFDETADPDLMRRLAARIGAPSP